MTTSQIQPEAEAAPETRDRVPLWLAVGITVVVSIPFTLWLGQYNLAVWCAFVVWAEYFALGAKPRAIRTILPSFAYSALLTGLSLAAIPLLSFLPSIVVPGDLSVAVALFVGVSFMVFSMRWSKTFTNGSLPFFNGISMVLAIYFTSSFPPIVEGWFVPVFAALWTILLAVFGVLLALFNVWITFPKTMRAKP